MKATQTLKMMRYNVTRNDIESRAKEHVPRIDELINAQDIDGSADSWEDLDSETVEYEVSECIEVCLSELGNHDPIKHMAWERSMCLWLDDMRRVNSDILNVESERELLISHRVWPNKMDKYEARDILEEHTSKLRDIPTDVWDQVREEISSGLYEGYWPKGVEQP